MNADTSTEPKASVTVPRLQLREVYRVFGSGELEVRAVDGVSLTVAAGEFVSIMGASGSGKSTLLHLAGGLDTPTSGEVVVDGTSLTGLSVAQVARLRRTRIGYVFQDFNLLPSLTAEENVAFPLELDGVSFREARAGALAALDAVGVGDLASRVPEDMSGGQVQRVAIARALVGERSLLLADEPTGALDSATSQVIAQILRDRADAGVSVVLVTHDARLAAWADRTVHMRDGRIVGKTVAEDFAWDR